MANPKPITPGERFGKLTVVKESERRSAGRSVRRRALAKCDCGTLKVYDMTSLRSGNTKSCGCLVIDNCLSRTKHGHSRRSGSTRAYEIWTGMIKRCTNPKEKSFDRYGGRGIRVCDRWLESYENFYADMGDAPDGMSLERKDNNGNYELSNCKWATLTEQSNNRRNNTFIEFDGRRLTIAQWARETGLLEGRIQWRYSQGWPVEKVLTTPAGKGRNQFSK